MDISRCLCTTPCQQFTAAVVQPSTVLLNTCYPLIHPASQSLLQAILLVQQNNSAAAIEMLEPLFEHIEPMQENVAVRVCLLLMELYLAGTLYTQAASRVAFLHHMHAEQQATLVAGVFV